MMGCVSARADEGRYSERANYPNPSSDGGLKTTELGDLIRWTGSYDIQEGDEDWISNLDLKIESAPSQLKVQFALKDLLLASGSIKDFNTGEKVIFSGSIVVPTEDGGGYFSLGPFKLILALASDGTRILLCGGYVYRHQD
jgi:hypothetical protein